MYCISEDWYILVYLMLLPLALFLSFSWLGSVLLPSISDGFLFWIYSWTLYVLVTTEGWGKFFLTLLRLFLRLTSSYLVLWFFYECNWDGLELTYWDFRVNSSKLKGDEPYRLCCEVFSSFEKMLSFTSLCNSFRSCWAFMYCKSDFLTYLWVAELNSLPEALSRKSLLPNLMLFEVS